MENEEYKTRIELLRQINARVVKHAACNDHLFLERMIVTLEERVIEGCSPEEQLLLEWAYSFKRLLHAGPENLI
ncbi:hypothetical protein [Pseudomonas oryzihabitans]|uniref:Uncharacterized protein n=1 Tax=Pseudomonas oryzihabitans TaxID=47885 RepID=A0ABX3IL99_9PSED|nr:hypothetical protein [Pseudomonas psychrotolerans]ONN68656.1 hypothetical protein BVL52_24400 [Pseudomonas psychrotolerans]